MIKINIKKYLSVGNLILGGMLIAGFYLRICHITHGTHYVFNHDGLNFIEQALRYGKGTLKPFGMLHGPFLPYILFFEYSLYFLINLFISRMSSPADLLREYVTDPSNFFMIGGLTSVFFSMGAMFLVNFICKKYFNEKIALCVVLFTAVSFYMVYLSHVIKEDIIAGFLMLCSYYFASKTLNADKWIKPLYISALFIGLAISVKYYAFIGVFIILAVLIFKLKDKKITASHLFWQLLKSAAIIVSVFIILNPHTVLNFKEFIRELSVMKTGFSESVDLYNRPSLLLYLIFLKEGIGWPVFLLYLCSLFLIFSNRYILVCNVFPILLFLFLSFFERAMPYLLVALIPFVLISSAFFLIESIEFFIKNKRVCIGFIFVMVILCASVTFIASWKFCRILNLEDTRMIAKRWIESNIRKDSRILIEGSYTFNIIYAPQLRENMNTLEEESSSIKKSGGSGFLWEYKKKYFNTRKGASYQLYKTTVISPDDIKKYIPEYIILTSYQASPLSIQVRNYLQGKYELIKNISSDVCVYGFPSFEALYQGTLEKLNSLDLRFLNAIHCYGPAIEVYRKI